MSSAPDAHGHDAHDAHAFTGEPTQVLPPDEPRTPGWLPPLGVALFTGAAVVFLAGRGGADEAAAKPEQAEPAPPRPAAVAPAQPAEPAQPGVDVPRKLTPEQLIEVRKRIQEMEAKEPAPGAKTNAKEPAPGAKTNANEPAPGAKAKGKERVPDAKKPARRR